MHKNIPWYILILGGLLGILLGHLIGDVIGSAIGTVGVICFWIGITNGIIAYLKHRKQKTTDTAGIKFPKIEVKNLIIALLVLIIIILSISLFIKYHEERERGEYLQEDLTSVQEIDTLDSLDPIRIHKYDVEVLQIGGIGSRTNQITAHNLEDQEYLKPSEDWVEVSFNSPADIMDVGCRDGYFTYECVVNGESIKYIDDVLGCRAFLKNQMQNRVYISCIRE